MRTASSRRFPTLVALLCALAPLGCGDEASGPGAGGPSAVATPIAFADYCDRYAQMTCDVARTCDCLAGTGHATCVTYQTVACREDVEPPVEEGRRRWDAAAAGQCLAELEAIAADCSLSDAYWPEACDAMEVGIVPANGACESDRDCAGGLACAGGVCRTLPGDGEPCDAEYGCADEDFCGDDGLCHAYRGPGGACPEGSRACADELTCNPSTETCEPYRGEGESCADAPSACDSELGCAPATQTCEPYPSAGASCVETDRCREGVYCGADGLCHDEKVEGVACAGDDECATGHCDGQRCAAESDVCSATL